MQDSEKLALVALEGESSTVELKERLGHLDREIVAFANASGGKIFLGIKDSGHISGIELSNDIKSQIIDIARNCDPSIQIELHAYRSSGVLEIQVAEGVDKPYRCRDGFFLRVGPNSQKLKRDEIIHFMNESGKMRFDEAISRVFRFPEDFSQSALNEFLRQAGYATKASSEDILYSLNLAEEQAGRFLLRNAGVLFFAKTPQHFFPESFITAVLYRSQDRFSIIDKKDFLGAPMMQIEDALHFMMKHIAVSADFSSVIMGQGGARKEVYDYPLLALREAVVNAVTHRDYYYDSSHIYIHMYPDRIEIENPGGLYKGLTVETLGQRSVRRNRLIADMLHRIGYIERVGSGFDRMRNTLEENDNPPFEVSPTNFFNIRFLKRVEDEHLLALTSRQRQLYQLAQGKQHITKKEAASYLSVSEDTALREIKVLIAAGIITQQGRGKATSYVPKKRK